MLCITVQHEVKETLVNKTKKKKADAAKKKGKQKAGNNDDFLQ